MIKQFLFPMYFTCELKKGSCPNKVARIENNWIQEYLYHNTGQKFCDRICSKAEIICALISTILKFVHMKEISTLHHNRAHDERDAAFDGVKWFLFTICHLQTNSILARPQSMSSANNTRVAQVVDWEGFPKKSSCSFGFCPNYLDPPSP